MFTYSIYRFGSGKNTISRYPVAHTEVWIETLEATFRKLECIVDMLLGAVCLFITPILHHNNIGSTNHNCA